MHNRLDVNLSAVYNDVFQKRKVLLWCVLVSITPQMDATDNLYINASVKKTLVTLKGHWAE